MVPPLLRLAFVQGPRHGDSLEYKPGSIIRIGRIVRGNEIAIKDAGISTKHLRIVSDSENWIIHDLGSSNGTFLNSDTLDPDTPVNLRHGDVIKLGEFSSIVVNFETVVQAQEHKLPPKPRRNARRRAVPDPDPDPIESVQEKPTRKGRSSKQDEHESPKIKRGTKSKIVEDIADKERELEVENEKEVNLRVSRSRKNEEEEVPVEKKGNSRARRGKKTESVQKLGLESIKLETEDTPKGVSAMERATRSHQKEKNACLGFENVKSEDAVLEEKHEKITLRATRSRKKEIGGDSLLELEMILNQARKSRAKKKKMEQKPSKNVEMEARNDDVEEDKEDEKDVEAQKGCSERKETSKRVEQVEIELRKSTSGEEDLNCTVREDGCTEIDEEAGTETSNGGCDEKEVDEQVSSDKNVEKVEVDLGKMTLGEWFGFMEAHLRKQIVEETEKIIEPMRCKTQRVHKYIAEQKQAKGKEREKLIRHG